MESQPALKIVQGSLKTHRRKVIYSNEASLKSCFPFLFISLEMCWQLRYDQQAFTLQTFSRTLQANVPFQFSAK